MTDNEIIKALECCTQTKIGCAGCPFENDYQNCSKSDIYVIDLIKRQKAEIERLKKENKILSANADTAFQDGLNENRDLFKKEVEHEIKSEAIKKFADRLKEKSEHFWEEKENFVSEADIDNLVNEMTEEEEK